MKSIINQLYFETKVGKVKYYADSTGKAIIKNKNGEEKVIFAAKDGWALHEYIILGDYMIVKNYVGDYVIDGMYYNIDVYLLNIKTGKYKKIGKMYVS